VFRKPVSSSDGDGRGGSSNNSAFNSQMTPGDPIGLCYQELLSRYPLSVLTFPVFYGL